MEDLKKIYNSDSVALKARQKEMKDLNKELNKEKEMYEKKIFEPNEYKKILLNEEREEKIKKRKELKKAKQKLKKNINEKAFDDETDANDLDKDAVLDNTFFKTDVFKVVEDKPNEPVSTDAIKTEVKSEVDNINTEFDQDAFFDVILESFSIAQDEVNKRLLKSFGKPY